MSAMKADAEAATGYKSQIDALTKEKARLEKAIADGAADAETAKALKQAKADLANITTQYNELNTKYTDIQEAHKKELFAIKIDRELQTAAGGIKFKAGLPGNSYTRNFATSHGKNKGHESRIYRRWQGRQNFGV